jgi:mannitol-1-phosphate/altronate dehydrogenase
VHRAFTEESGKALVARYGNLGDPLFTALGFRAYADDLLRRMTNPYLADTVARAVRDPARKLGWSDRLFGAMRLCWANEVESASLAVGAVAGVWALPEGGMARRLMSGDEIDRCLERLWGAACPEVERVRMSGVLEQAQLRLRRLVQ